jgi:hypothetical protein
MPNGKEPSRESLFERFFGGSQRSWREAKILRYIIYRVSDGSNLHDVIQEDYVRRNCSEGEIDRIVRDPELVHACREYLWRAFGSGELDPKLRVRRRLSLTDTDDSLVNRGAGSDPASPGDEQSLMGKRSTPPDGCDHSGPAMVERTVGGYTMRCLTCRKVGPVRRTPEAARKALLVLGARDGWRQEGPA